MLVRPNTAAAKILFARLGKSKSGNTLAMLAAALIPIAGVIGSGVDIGRGYMARARMQQACDAGVLAARRGMDGNTLSTENVAEGKRFFLFNFPTGTFGTDALASNYPEITNGNEPQVVNGKAETKMPTSVMKLFGKDTIDLKVTCSSRLDVGNVDVMMVLDVTGSMAGSRLTGLKAAVKDFYLTLGAGGGTAGNQVRYGFVPYSSTVNMGSVLYNKDKTWLVGGSPNDKWDYQTRVPIWEVNDPNGSGTPTVTTTTQTQTLSSVDGPECTNQYSQNQSVPGWWTASPSGNPIVSVDGNGIKTEDTYTYVSWNGSAAQPPSNAVGSGYWRTCRRLRTRVVTEPAADAKIESTTWQAGATFLRYEYKQHDHDVTGYVNSLAAGSSQVVDPTDKDRPVNQRWAGCIEERDSVHTTATQANIPNGALDMDITTLPTDKASRWRPFWPQVLYNRTSLANGWAVGTSGGTAACPAPSRNLKTYPTNSGDTYGQSTELNNYIDSLAANGGTNHNIGLVWGARLIAEGGLFAAENANPSNNLPIGRHVVFMTDGDLTISTDNYVAWGFPELDGRTAPANTDSGTLRNIHEQRFNLLCSRIKSAGITLWVVQFGYTTVSSNMSACASDPGHATAAADTAALKAAFADIATNIGGLRISE